MTFLGRERELAQLAEAIRRVAEGRLGRVALTGPAGIGSTRLLDELVRRVSSVPGVVTSRGRAFEPAQHLPYYAVGEAIAAALEAVEDEDLAAVVGTAGHDLSVLVPELGERLDALEIERAPPSLLAPDQLGRRVMESILGTLERLANGGVLVLILEDLHFADPATRGFIDAMQGVGKGLPVCLIVSYQPDELHRRHPVRELSERLMHDPDYTHIELGPLGPRELERLVTGGAEERPAADVVTAVVEGARGNPLMAKRLTASATRLEGVRLSDSYDQLIAAQLEALPPEAVRAVRLMALAKAPLPPEVFLSADLRGDRITWQGVEDAVAAGLVVERGERLVISSDLTAEAVEALELPPERKALHAALAERLADEPALSAWHWERAARPTEARDAHIRAATSAMQLDPGESVLGHFQQALELPGTEDATPEERAALLAGAAAASATAGRFRRAVAFERRAIESRAAREASAARGRRDDATRLVLGEMYAELGRYQWGAGELDGALDSMERALGVMPALPTRIRARAEAQLAQHLMLSGRFAESAEVARSARATAIAAARLDEDTLAELGHATCTLGVDAAYLGDLSEGLELLEEASSMARQAGRLDDLMRVAANRTTLLDLDSRREKALEVIKTFLVEAEAGGLAASYGAFLRGNGADILYHLGRWPEAEAECRFAAGWRMSAYEAEWWPPLVLGLLLTESRGDEESASLVGQAVLQLQTVPAGQWTGHMLRAAVSQALLSGDPAAALTIAEREWPRALESDELAIVSWSAATSLEAAAAAAEHGRVSSDPGLIARARDLAALVVPQAEAHVARSTFGPELGVRQEAELLLDTARTHAARIRDQQDPAAWDRLATEWQSRGMPYRQANARRWQALALLAAADEDARGAARAAAREPLAEAYRLARELPALPLLRQIVDLSARARVPLPIKGPTASVAAEDLIAVGPGLPRPVAVGPGRPTSAPASDGADIARAIEERVIAALREGPADAYGLSPREREVLNIVAEGRTDRDIAARLFISERTVHVHVRRILAKLGVSSRTEAAGVAIRGGLVPAQLPAGDDPKSADDVASRS
jgi:DNA-binding CsgD family transcriptional regulator/tetratricopeptide (TPR) repeat protein